MAGEPLPDLTALVSLMEPKSFRGVVAKAQKAAWNEWAGIALPSRFGQTQHPNPWGFAQRSAQYMRRRASASAAARLRAQARGVAAINDNKGATKGDLPDYVYTGAGKREVMKRRAKSSYTADSVTTRRSIHMRALNALGSKRGWTVQREIKQSKTVTRRAHQRRSSTGTMVNVRSYKQTAHVIAWSGTESNKTYSQEWAYTPDEIAQVSRRSDEILREALVRIGYDKKGSLKLKFRREIERRAQAEGA